MNKASRTNEELQPQELQAVGLALSDLSYGMLGFRQLQYELVGINIKRPKEANGEFLLVVKGLDEEGTPMVAFHSAFTLGEAIRGVAGRLRNGTLKWRVDEWVS